MPYLVITLSRPGAQDTCALCGSPLAPAVAAGLVLGDSLAPVCRECGKKHAPSLVALLELAHIAERVGCIGRHIVVPPLEALLDLAHAAEDYTRAISVRKIKAFHPRPVTSALAS